MERNNSHHEYVRIFSPCIVDEFSADNDDFPTAASTKSGKTSSRSTSGGPHEEETALGPSATGKKFIIEVKI